MTVVTKRSLHTLSRWSAYTCQQVAYYKSVAPIRQWSRLLSRDGYQFMRGFNYTALTGTISVCCGYMWKFHYLLIHQYFKNLLLVLCCIVTSSPKYIYCMQLWSKTRKRNYVLHVWYVHVQNDRQLVKGRKKLHCLSLGRHDFIYIPTPQCCYYALLTESV